MKIMPSIRFPMALLSCSIVGQASFSQSITWQQASVGIGDTAVVNSFSGNPQGQIFAGVPLSGLFRSSNNGQTWALTTPKPPAIEINDIAIDSSGWIFVGDYFGVFRSTDNGVSWAKRNVGFRDTLAPVVNKIIVNHNGFIFAAPRDFGLYRSTNRGETWQECAKGFQSLTVTCLAIDFRGDLFVGTAPAMGYGGSFVSTDEGDSWTGPMFSGKTILSTVVNSAGVVFAATQYPGSLFRSSDRGQTWDTLSTNSSIYLLGVNSAGQLFGVTPRTPPSTYTTGVVRSTDNGKTWFSMNQGLPDTTSIISIFIPSNDYVFLGTSHHGIYRSSEPTTAVTVSQSAVAAYSLGQNYPNPFNPNTTIEFSIPKRTYVTLLVYNLLGEKIATLASQEFRAGSHRVGWNAKGVASGVYLYCLVAGSFVETKKMLLVR
jgi:photosystem II stability/assembly factor-like uncharacterized protein